MNMVRHWAWHKFEQPCWDVIPRITIGYEPGSWGYAATLWIGFGWLNRSWQFSLYRGSRLPKVQDDTP